MTTKRPLVTVISMCCTLWCRLNVNCNYGAGQGLKGETLEKLREVDREMLEEMVWTMV